MADEQPLTLGEKRVMQGLTGDWRRPGAVRMALDLPATMAAASQVFLVLRTLADRGVIESRHVGLGAGREFRLTE